MSDAPATLQILPVNGIGEVTEGTDLVGLVLDHADLRDGDIVVVTSKIVSKAEGRVLRGDRRDAAQAETVRVLARRGETAIVRNRQGIVLAGAGVDASNTEPGTVLLLPVDPDDSARRLRAGLTARAGVRVGVVVSDTAGRAWRQGQTDIAIGAAGVVVADDHAGRVDTYGNELAVTVSAVADELAGAADLVKGKLRQCPVAVVRGMSDLVTCDDGPGARSLQRSDDEDLFGLGARRAVIGAAGAVEVPQEAYGAALTGQELARVLSALPHPGAELSVDVTTDRIAVTVRGDSPVDRTRVATLVDVVCFASGWSSTPSEDSETGVWTRVITRST